MGGDFLVRKSTVKRVWLLCRFKSLPSPLMRVSRNLESSFSSKYREGDFPLQMEISLINIHVPYKR